MLQGELDNAYALSRPPGHHCLPDQSMGFCFLANIPIAIERAKAQYGLGKVAVLDWDVHHGNGTQHIYWQRDDVLTLSLHQDGCFPVGYSGEQDRGAGAGEGFNINVPLLVELLQCRDDDLLHGVLIPRHRPRPERNIDVISPLPAPSPRSCSPA